MPFDPVRVRALCFDIDGTLSDTDDQWVEKLSRFFTPLRFFFRRGEPRPFARRLVMMAETPANAAYSPARPSPSDDEALRLLAALNVGARGAPSHLPIDPRRGCHVAPPA